MDLDRLRIPDVGWQYSAPLAQRKRSKRRGEFLKGPVPIAWVERACALGGKAAALAWALRFKAGMSSNRPIPATPRLLERFGMSSRSAYRALASLESAGLITVQRRRGASPLVTVLDVADDTEVEPCED